MRVAAVCLLLAIHGRTGGASRQSLALLPSFRLGAGHASPGYGMLAAGVPAISAAPAPAATHLLTDGGLLTGPIPRELTTCFPEIDEIDLSYNQARCTLRRAALCCAALCCAALHCLCALLLCRPAPRMLRPLLALFPLAAELCVAIHTSIPDPSTRQLTGTIPAFLGTLTKLEELKVGSSLRGCWHYSCVRKCGTCTPCALLATTTAQGICIHPQPLLPDPAPPRDHLMRCRWSTTT